MSWLSRLFSEAAPTGDPERVRAVEEVLEELRPMLRADGGDFELVSVEGDRITLRPKGACVGCFAQATTLTQALEKRLRERCPWMGELRAS